MVAGIPSDATEATRQPADAIPRQSRNHPLRQAIRVSLKMSTGRPRRPACESQRHNHGAAGGQFVAPAPDRVRPSAARTVRPARGPHHPRPSNPRSHLVAGQLVCADGVAADAGRAGTCPDVLTKKIRRMVRNGGRLSLRAGEEHEPPVRHHGAVHDGQGRRNQTSGMSGRACRRPRLRADPPPGG